MSFSRPLGFVDVSLRELVVGNRLELAVDEQLGKGKEGVKLKKDPKKVSEIASLPK